MLNLVISIFIVVSIFIGWHTATALSWCIFIHALHALTHTLTVTTTELVTIPDNRQQELLAEFERRRKVRDLAVASLEQDRKIVFNVSHFSDHQCCVIHNLFFCFSAQAKAIVVPTDDAEVKARLREQGEPICTHTQSHLLGGGCHHRA